MERLLIIYDDVEVRSVSIYTENTSISTPHKVLIENRENAISILQGIGIDVKLLEDN